MKLKEYLDKYSIDPQDFAVNHCYYIEKGKRKHIGVACIYKYLSGAAEPWQRNAEIIERATDGLVTVKELRGKDDRQNSNSNRVRRDSARRKAGRLGSNP